MATDQSRARFDVLEVLMRSGVDRDEFCAALDDDPEVDALLVADVIRVSGRVAATAARRRELTCLCGIMRAIDAQVGGRIDAGELRDGLAVHAARTDRFEHFGAARVLLRTIAEVLDPAHGGGPGVRAQVEFLHAELRVLLTAELTGESPHGAIDDAECVGPVDTASDDSADALPGDSAEAVAVETRDQIDAVESDDSARAAAGTAATVVPVAWCITDDARRGRLASLARELVDGPPGHPLTGVAATAWQRGFSAVPVAGSRVGDLDEEEIARLAEWLIGAGRRELIEVELQRPPMWRVDGRAVTVLDRTLVSRAVPATPRDIAAAVRRDPRPRCISTDDAGSFLVLEFDEHHVVAGGRADVEAICGCSVHDALGRFREYVETLAVDGEPPEELLEVADRFGRLGRRGSAVASGDA